MSKPTKTKDPDSTLDYGVDWSEWLDDGDEIASSMWLSITPSTSPALEYETGSEATDSNSTKIEITGGKVGVRYTVTNRITTDNGLTHDFTFFIEVFPE